MRRLAGKKKRIVLLSVLLAVLLGCLTMIGCAGKDEDTGKSVQNDTGKITSEPTALPTAAATPEPTEEITPEPSPEEVPVLTPEEVVVQDTGKKIAIDAGHQAHGNSEQEPVGPGASRTKAKVASGTSGRTTGVAEYELNLAVALKLREELEARGYEVYMIRETHEVDISNAERAQKAADSGADILVRIHANGSENSSVSGALTMSPSASNPYMDSELVSQCQRLSSVMIEAFCEATGANNQGVYETDEMSGLNWCTIPATIVEMGYMTNPGEDTRMQTEEYQNQMVQGMANGIDRYFES